MAPSIVSPEELSKSGRVVLSAAAALLESGNKAPLSAKSVWLTCVDVLGGDRGIFRDYLKIILDAGGGVETEEILRRVRCKQLLVEVINEASGQLTKGNLDTPAILALLKPEHETLTPLASTVTDDLPDPPSGISIKTLPGLSEKCGGLFGFWAVAGEPGVGKSTLAWQLSLDIGRQIPVLYYDFENGDRVLLYHTAEAFGHDVERIRSLTARLYYRDSIRSLDTDLSVIPPPALIVIDSVQKLPAHIEYRRQGLDKWVHRFETLKKQGYTILLVSEMNRASYGRDPYVGVFKETGEIEYSADFGIQMVDQGGYIQLYLVKNRHFPFKGHAVTLKRVNSWWYQEI